MAKHLNAVKALTAAIQDRVAKVSSLTIGAGTPAEHEARFFEAEGIRDEIAQLQKAIEILEK